MAEESSGTLRLLRPTEAAKALNLHPQSLANMRAQGRGPDYIKLGAAVRYSTEALRSYVEANTVDVRGGKE